ncbi:MAG: molybdopterin-dependent oxidoreductase, partial [Gaiellaceae bacterium]
LGFEGKPGCGAFHLPVTPNGRGVAAAWAASADADETRPEASSVLVVSCEDAAADPGVRALAEQAEQVIVVTMFHELAGGWADLILPATGALERDGTTMNLEGRLQRLRRAVAPPCPDELAWISKLAARFGVEISPHALLVFAELSRRLFQDLSMDEIGLRAPLPSRTPYEAPPPAAETARLPKHATGELRLQRYHALLSGPAVERVRELEFQRPEREVEISAVDARRRGISSGDCVHVRSNGTSVELRARVNRRLLEGIARVAEEHAADLHTAVEVAKA